uniref:Uncharacterized protein n=1 Tax=Cyprinus carpio carpio TaxID=630221 RepID=A0A9J7Y741_CYPCA
MILPVVSGLKMKRKSLSLAVSLRLHCSRGHPINIVHCSPEPLNSSDPPASASQQLGLQAHATAPGESCEHQRCY